MNREEREYLRGRLVEVRERVVAAIAPKLLQEEPEQFGLDERTGEAIPFDELKRVPWVRTAQMRARERDLLAADSDVLLAYRNERYAG